jgi:adenylate cyclase
VINLPFGFMAANIGDKRHRRTAMWRQLRNGVLGTTGTAGALPGRVGAIIAAREIEGERLIGWAQLVVGVIWLILYAASPKTFSGSATFAPVPIALALYLGFTLLRLSLLYRGFSPAWLLTLSVAFDVTLLMGLIWSFHVQYGQPAAFYLKAPTLLYVFIFIALRALRFSATYLVLAGALAGFGWLVLLVYAIWESKAPGMGVTRDYVHYMTSSSILLGAEIDKIIAIFMSTAILAVAIVRARRLLIVSVTEEAAHRDLQRFFAPEVAAQITRAEQRIQAGMGEQRDAAILFADVRGFSELATRVPPASLMTLLAEYQTRMVRVIQAHGGSIDKFLGDGIMATFGAAAPSETYAADALRAVAALIAAAGDWAEQRRHLGEEPLTIGFAAVAGRVVFGAVGDGDRLEFTVIGDAVNQAAKIEKQTKVEGVAALTTAATLALARAQGYRPERAPARIGGRDIPGLAAPVELVALGRG